MLKGFNPRTCRLLGWSTLFMVICGIVLCIIVGMIDVPSSSPLADPLYVIRELNDPTIPWDAELPPGTVTPVNMLNNGEPIITIGLILPLIIYGAILILALKFEEWSRSLSMVTMCELFAGVGIIRDLTNIVFTYDYLRPGAQSLIDDSHHLRVVVAYIQLGCEQFGVMKAESITVAIFIVLFYLSYAIAGIAEYRYWKHEKELTS